MATPPQSATSAQDHESGRKAMISKDYSTSASALRLATSDGGRFVVDKTILSTFSPIFKTMFEDAMDTNETLVLLDSGPSWSILLDLMYDKEASADVALDALGDALALAIKYEMKFLRDHLFTILLERIKTEPTAVNQTITKAGYRNDMVERLMSWEQESRSIRPYHSLCSINFNTPIKTLLDEYHMARIQVLIEKARDELRVVACYMSQFQLKRCNTRFHSGIGQKMGHKQWQCAISWMRKQATRSDYVLSPQDALDLCKSQYDSIAECDRCTEQLLAKFDCVQVMMNERGM